ncbi:MAG: sulfatase [bacterium]
MKFIKIVGIAFFFLILISLAVFFTFILPDDKRVKSPGFDLQEIRQKRATVHDLIKLSPKAEISHKNFDEQYQMLLKTYPYLNDNRDYHLTPENMHVSLGWYPLRIIHQNSLFAPPSTAITYELTLPKNKPRLEFSCGVINEPCEFIVKIIDSQNKTHDIFREKINPFKIFPYRHRDKFNKNFHQYLNVQMEDRDSKWHEYKASLTGFSGKDIKLILETNGSGGPAFWANPVITEVDENPAQKTNLIFIIVDSLRKDAVGVKNLTPNLDKLASEGASFEKAIANGNMTKQSVTSFLTSKLPFELGEISLEYVSSKESRNNFYKSNIPTLATILNKHGYYTGSIGTISLITDGAGFGVDSGFNDARIIERYGYSNVHITNEAINWLNQYGDKPFGLLLYYDAPHGPYKPPLKYFFRTRKTLDEFTSEKWYRTLYEADVNYTDEYIGKLLNAVDKMELSENTLVVVLSDHGENLEVHTLPGGKKAVFHDHGISLRDGDVNVPLLMRLPGKIKAGLKITKTVQLLDLMPAIFGLMDIKTTEKFTGKSMMGVLDHGSSATADKRGKGQEENNVIFMRGRFNKGVRVSDKYKYIRNFGVYDKRGKKMQVFVPEELYDLENDPAETVNIIEKEAALRQKMRNILDQYEPDPEVNIVKFYNPERKEITGTIAVKGKFGNYSMEGAGKTKIKSNILEFEVTSEKAVLNFATLPPNASLSVSIKNSLKEVPLSKILVSGYALPLLKDGRKEIGGEDFYLMKGVPPDVDSGGKLQISWGREAKYKLEWEKQKGVTGTFKEMLSEWGYLSEPEKK